MKKYISPRVKIYDITLEFSLAAGSAAVKPYLNEEEGIVESWDQDFLTQDIEW